MKKSSLVIMLLCSCLLLSSCSRLSDISITKRHYRSGYYVDLGGSHKQNKTKHRASATVTTEAKTTEITTTAPVTATAIPSASDELKENSAVAPEKTISEASPVLVTATIKEKKQSPKKVSDNVYASSQDLSDITMEIQATLLKNSIAVNTSKENNIISSSASSSGASVPQWLLIVFAIILPPLAIGLMYGIIDKFWISCLLTLLFWIPGVIYAIYWVTKN